MICYLWNEIEVDKFDDVPEEGGVYIIYRNNWISKVCVYTGQAQNLKTRIKQHWSENEENVKLRNAIQANPYGFAVYYCCVDGRSIDNVEKYLFDYYRPEYGERAPDVTSKAIVLPDDVE